MPHRDPQAKRSYQRSYHKSNYVGEGNEKKVLWSGRLPVSLLARVQRITQEGIATGKFPWKTTTMTVTALLIRGLESLAGDPMIDEMLPYLRAISQIDGVASHRTEAQAAFSKTKTEISELLNIKAHDEAVQYFHAIFNSIEEMDENVWRDWLLRKLKETFPKLVAEKPKGTNMFLRFGADRDAKREKQRKERRSGQPKRRRR